MKKLFVLIILMLLVGCRPGWGTGGGADPHWYGTGAGAHEPTPEIIAVTATPASIALPTSTACPVRPTREIIPRATGTDPTFNEMIYFLNHNHINWNEYVADGYDRYVCFHFACDVQQAAHEQGIRCAMVAIHFPVGGHAIVAFETTDKGLVYIEPQVDLPTKVEIGRKYWSWIAGPVYSIDYDDTVVEITLFWHRHLQCP